MWKSQVWVAVAAVVVVQSGVALLDAARYIQKAPAASEQAVNRPLVAYQIDPSWIRSGTPQFSATETVRAADGRSVSGLWACDGPGSFQWTFAFDETVHVLEGEVHVEYQGRRFTLRPGDTATFHHGTQAIWHVPQRLKKAYTLHQPSRLTLLWRWAIKEA